MIHDPSPSAQLSRRLRAVAALGTEGIGDLQSTRRTRLTNVLALASTLAAACWLLGAVILRQGLTAAVTGIDIVVFLGCFTLNVSRHPLLARTVFLVTWNVSVFVLANLAGAAGNVHFLFLVAAAITFLLFSRRRETAAFVAMQLLPLLGWLLLEISNYSLLPAPSASEGTARVISFFTWGTAFELILVVLAYYSATTEYVEERMLAARDAAESAAAEMKRSEGELRLLLEMCPFGVLIEDAGTAHVSFLNTTFVQMFGYTIEELPTSREFFAKASTGAEPGNNLADQWAVQARRAELRTGAVEPLEAETTTKDGMKRFVRLSVSSIGTKNILMVVDLSERRAVEEAILAARTAAESASAAKSAFLANMSHEIRTPMNAILGFAQLLERDGTLNSAQKDQIRTILRAGDHLLSLINDVLEMSRIEAGRTELQPGSFDLHALLDDIDRMFSVRATEKHLQFEVERIGAVPRYIRTDEGKLRQILINMLGNAVKFTIDGGVVLRVGTVEHAGARRLVAEVEDTGPGIAVDELRKVFEAFAQTQAGIDAKAGTGLGMPLSRAYARLMGGDLTVTSEVGRGSLFRMEIGLVETDAADVAVREPTVSIRRLKPGQEVRVLVVDDKPDNRAFLTALLGSVGFSVREAENGLEALDLWESWQPKVILLDLHMPILDGYETTRRIKATVHGAETLVIAVSASVLNEDAERVYETGVDAFIRKPFKAHELLEEMGRLAAIEYERGTVAETLVEPDEEGKDVVLSLGSLPVAAVGEIRAATLAADADRITAVIDRIADTADARVVAELRRMVMRYDYERLGELLGQAER